MLVSVRLALSHFSAFLVQGSHLLLAVLVLSGCFVVSSFAIFSPGNCHFGQYLHWKHVGSLHSDENVWILFNTLQLPQKVLL